MIVIPRSYPRSLLVDLAELRLQTKGSYIQLSNRKTFLYPFQLVPSPQIR